MTTRTTTENTSGLHQAEWAPLLCLGAQEVFDLMVGTPLLRHTAPESTGFLEYTAMVGLAGPICGIFSIRCTLQAAALIASGMLSTATEAASPQTRDALGEVCNMVVGHFKSKLGPIGENSMLSIPTVIRGSDYHLHSLVAGTTLESPMQFANELVMLRLDYKLTQPKGSI
jgi:CheY-specific phosphatase CheX